MLPSTTFSRIWDLSPSTLEGLRREFDSSLRTVTGAVCGGRHPAVSVWDSKQGITVEVDVPGVAGEDLDISIENGVLQITGQRREPQREGELKFCEHRYGEFRRTISLHDTLDPASVAAELDAGVLRLDIARKAEAQPRKIPISVRTKPDDSAES